MMEWRCTVRRWLARRLALLSVAFAVLAGLLDKEMVAFLCGYWEEIDDGIEQALAQAAQENRLDEIIRKHRRIQRRSAEHWPSWVK